MLSILNICSIAGCYLKYISDSHWLRIQNSADWVEFHIIKPKQQKLESIRVWLIKTAHLF